MIAELITEENLIIVLSHLNNIMFYMTIIVWVLFFFHLTNYMGCGMLHSENPIGFNSQMLVCAIFLTIGCIGLSWILGCLVETIKNMSMCLICVFVIACPILARHQPVGERSYIGGAEARSRLYLRFGRWRGGCYAGICERRGIGHSASFPLQKGRPGRNRFGSASCAYPFDSYPERIGYAFL